MRGQLWAVAATLCMFFMESPVEAGCGCIFRCRHACSHSRSSSYGNSAYQPNSGVMQFTWTANSSNATQMGFDPTGIVEKVVDEVIKRRNGTSTSTSSEQLTRIEDKLTSMHGEFVNFSTAVRDMGQTMTSIETILRDNKDVNDRLRESLDKLGSKNSNEVSTPTETKPGDLNSAIAEAKKEFDAGREKEWDARMKILEEQIRAALKPSMEPSERPAEAPKVKESEKKSRRGDRSSKEMPKGENPKASPKDAHAKDAGAKDAGAKDAGAKDAGAKDAGAKDAGAKDAGAKDAGAKDAGAKDADGKDAAK